MIGPTISTMAIVMGAVALFAAGLVGAPGVRGGETGPTVSIEDLSFAPRVLVVYEGESVTWVNNDTVDHTVTSVGYAPQPTPTPTPVPPATPFPTIEPSPEPGALFDFTLAPGESATFSFADFGRYAYFCRLHPSMTGEITFAPGTRPTDTPTPTPSEPPAPSMLPDASAGAPEAAPNEVLTGLGLALLLVGIFAAWLRGRRRTAS